MKSVKRTIFCFVKRQTFFSCCLFLYEIYQIFTIFLTVQWFLNNSPTVFVLFKRKKFTTCILKYLMVAAFHKNVNKNSSVNQSFEIIYNTSWVKLIHLSDLSYAQNVFLYHFKSKPLIISWSESNFEMHTSLKNIFRVMISLSLTLSSPGYFCLTMPRGYKKLGWWRH